GDDGAYLIAGGRHTGSYADWNTDVCSADLALLVDHAGDPVEVGVAAQAQIEGAVGGDRRRRVGVAAVDQIGKGQRPGARRGVVEDRKSVVEGGAGARGVGERRSAIVACDGQ